MDAAACDFFVSGGRGGGISVTQKVRGGLRGGRSVVRKARGGQSGSSNVSRFYFRPKRDKIYRLRFIVSSVFNKGNGFEIYDNPFCL